MKEKKVKFSRILLIIILLFIVFYIINKIFLYNILMKSNELYDEYVKKDNLYVSVNSYSEGDGQTTSISRIYINGNKKFSDTMVIAHDINNGFKNKVYYNDITNDSIRIFYHKDAIRYTVDEYENFGEESIIYSTIVKLYGDMEESNILEKIYFLFFKNKMMYLEKIDGQMCYVISVDQSDIEIDLVEKVWINIETLLPVREEVINNISTKGEDGMMQVSYSKTNVKFEFIENIVTDENVAWPDLNGQTIELID